MNEALLRAKDTETVCALEQSKCVIKWKPAADHQAISRLKVFPVDGSFFTLPTPNGP